MICRDELIKRCFLVILPVLIGAGQNSLLYMEGMEDPPVKGEWRGISCRYTCHPAAAMRSPERDSRFSRLLP